MQEIKECPYCGSDNAKMYSSVIKGSQVICQDCMMRGPSGYTDSIAKWNSLPRKSDIARLEKLSALQTDNIGYLNKSIRQLNKESDFLADALVSPFLNPDTHKDREYWRARAREAVLKSEAI